MFFSKKLSKFEKISHGFFNKSGGKSSGIYKSLNCGPGSKDKYVNIQKNLKIVKNKIGKGCKNIYLMECLKRENPNIAFKTTEALGIHPDWVEATAFAWLAKQNLLKKKINISHVTGAKFDSILGAIFQV